MFEDLIDILDIDDEIQLYVEDIYYYKIEEEYLVIHSIV